MVELVEVVVFDLQEDCKTTFPLSYEDMAENSILDALMLDRPLLEKMVDDFLTIMTR